MFFAGLFAIYFTARAQNPPATRGRPRRPSSTCRTRSWSRSCWWRRRSPASSACSRPSAATCSGCAAGTCSPWSMGTIFVLGQAYEYRTLVTEHGTTLASSAYGTVFYMATGFHALHVTGGLFAFVYLLIRTKLSKFTPAAGHRRDRRVVLLALRRRRVGRPVRRHLLHPLTDRGRRLTTASKTLPMTTTPDRAGRAGPAAVPPPAGRRHGARPRPAHRGGLYTALSPQPQVAQRPGRRRAGRQGPGALQQRLHHLPRREPAGRAGPRAEPDRRGRRGRLLPGLVRPDADGPPGGAGQPQAAAADVRPGHRGGRGQPGRARRVHPGQRRRPGRARPTPATPCAATDPARGGELFRLNCASCHNFTGRGGALSSGKFAPTLDPATESADLHRDAHRPAEHAEVLRPPAHAGGEEGHHRLHQVGARRTTTTPAATRWAASARCPRASIAFIVGLAATDRIRPVAGSQVMTTSHQASPATRRAARRAAELGRA